MDPLMHFKWCQGLFDTTPVTHLVGGFLLQALSLSNKVGGWGCVDATPSCTAWLTCTCNHNSSGWPVLHLM